MQHVHRRKCKNWALTQLVGNLSLLSLILAVTGCQTRTPQEKDPVETSEQDTVTSLSLASSYIDGGRPDKAMHELQEVLRDNPNNIDALNLMGITQLALSNPKRAVISLEKAWKLKATPATGINLSSAYMDLKRFKNAEKLLTGLLNRQDTPPYAHKERIYHNYGLVAEKTGRVVLAEKMFKKATEENPMFHLSHMRLAQLYKERKKPDLAVRSIEAARFGCPSCFEPLESLVEHYRSQGKHTVARHLIQDYKLNEGLSQVDRRRASDLENRIAGTARRENQDSPPKSR